MQTKGAFWSVLLSFWAALILSLGYAASAYLYLRYTVDETVALSTANYFVLGYGGLITGTACATLWLMSLLVLPLASTLIEDAVPAEEIEKTDFWYWKARFNSFHHGLAQFTTYFLGGFVIYTSLEFPVQEQAQTSLVLFTAFQFACGGFVGRKIWCIGHMLRSLEGVVPRDDLLESEALPKLIYLVNIFTFLVLLMTVVHTYFHVKIDFVSAHAASELMEPLVFLPLVLALPVLVLFNFYPRMVVNRLYLKSIRLKKDWLADKMSNLEEPEMAKLKHSVDYEKYLNEEFRYRQKVALSELPVALTIIVAILVTTARVLVN